uniref:Uncharacterized protein n=1 Tax=Sus scrofa TaxID=9823 RepID=A0A8D1EWJ5_PIG
MGKSSCLDHRTLLHVKHGNIALDKAIVFFHCKVSKLKPSLLVAMDTVMPFFFFLSFFLSFFFFLTCSYGICVLFPVSGCFLVDQ